MSNQSTGHEGHSRSDLQLSLLSLVDGGEQSHTLPLSATAERSVEDQQERRYRRLLARKERLGDLQGMAACYIRLGDLFLARGDSEEAGEMYRKSLKLARDANNASKRVPPSELF